MATINGTAGNDTLTGDSIDASGNGGDDIIHGGAGNDTIDGHDGNDQLFGDDGDDVFKVQITRSFATGETHSSYDGGAGLDTLDLSADSNTPVIIQAIDSSSFGLDVWIQGSFGVPGDWGHLPVQSIKSVEQIVLGSGDAQILLPDFDVGLMIDARNGDRGDGEYISTGHGNDTILGGNGADQVIYNGGSDTVALGAGSNDFVIATVSGNVDHSIVSGTGIFSIAGTALTTFPAVVDLAAGTATIGLATFAISGFETVSIEGSAHVSTVAGDANANLILGSNTTPGALILDGRGGDDQVVGGLGDDRVDGGDGNDILRGNGGNDSIQGGTGDDRLNGGVGDNQLDGGDGNDWISGGGNVPDHIGGNPVLGSSGADTITGGNGSDHIWGNDQSAAPGNVDDADSILAGAGNDYVNGNAGADTIDGGAGNDRLRGGRDGDQIFGGDDNDTILGETGADTLHGGLGHDLLTGGADADVFAFSFVLDGGMLKSDAAFTTTGASAGVTDIVADFQDGTDKFELSFTPAAVLNGSASDFPQAATVAQQLLDGHAGNSEVAAVQVGADTYLFFSIIGGGFVDSAVKVAGVDAASFDSGDFV